LRFLSYGWESLLGIYLLAVRRKPFFECIHWELISWNRCSWFLAFVFHGWPQGRRPKIRISGGVSRLDSRPGHGDGCRSARFPAGRALACYISIGQIRWKNRQNGKSGFSRSGGHMVLTVVFTVLLLILTSYGQIVKSTTGGTAVQIPVYVTDTARWRNDNACWAFLT